MDTVRKRKRIRSALTVLRVACAWHSGVQVVGLALHGDTLATASKDRTCKRTPGVSAA